MKRSPDLVYQRNIRGYAWFQFASSMLGWLPIFFLYFNQFVDLPDVIRLGAIYYFSVCICEVPSGYFSDRAGRRVTLLIGGFAFISSYLTFLFAASFIGLAAGQFLLALGIAMMSGTDTAFLYDSLCDLDKQEEYAHHEARGQKYSLAALAAASLAGGALGMVDLRLAYVLSLGGACCTVWLAWRFVEPAAHGKSGRTTGTMTDTITECIRYLSNPVLAWLFGVMMLMYCLEHVAFEFYQPYIKLLDLEWLQQQGTPMISGLVIATSMFGGTIGAAYSVQLYQRLGVKKLLFSAFLIQLVIVGGLALVLGSAMLCLVVFRNFPMAMIHAPVNDTIAPRIGSHLRATYLSLQSLSARLAFSTLLFLLSKSIDGAGEVDWPSLSRVLRLALGFGMVGILIALVSAPRITPVVQPKSPPSS